MAWAFIELGLGFGSENLFAKIFAHEDLSEVIERIEHADIFWSPARSTELSRVEQLDDENSARLQTVGDF